MSKEISKASEEPVTDEPLVSVLIPVYNVSRYLPQCLDSVISQTYRRLEIIIIDDGSTDDSGSICDRYAERDDRIHVIHSGNSGLSAARNLGLEYVSGQYISFLDSDDWIEPHTIETLMNAAQLTGADIVDARKCSEYVGETVHRSSETKYSYTYSGQDIMSAFAEKWIDNVVWNKLYRAECFENIRFPEGCTYEDIATVWKLMKNRAENGGTVAAVSDELFHYRIRKSSISHSLSYRNVKDSWIAYSAKYEAMPDYQDKLLTERFGPVIRMWMSYSGYSREEKADAQKMIREMQAFSRKNFHRVMKGNYPQRTKIICLLAQSKSAPVMWISYCGGKLRRSLKNRKHRMFK